MIQSVDQDGHHWWRLSKDEVRLGFLTQCVERVAYELGVDYTEMFDRLEVAGLTEDFIIRHYDVLHTQSIENVVSDIIIALNERENCKV